VKSRHGEQGTRLQPRNPALPPSPHPLFLTALAESVLNASGIEKEEALSFTNHIRVVPQKSCKILARLPVSPSIWDAPQFGVSQACVQVGIAGPLRIARRRPPFQVQSLFLRRSFLPGDDLWPPPVFFRGTLRVGFVGYPSSSPQSEAGDVVEHMGFSFPQRRDGHAS